MPSRSTTWLALALMLCAAASTSADTFIWTGAAGDNDFTNAANWQGGVAPADGADVEITATTSGNQSVFVSAPVSLHNLSLGSENYFIPTFAGNSDPKSTLTITGSVTAGSSGQTYAFITADTPLHLTTGDHIFDVGASSLLATHGVSGDGSITKTGEGRLALYTGYGSNTFSGGLTIDGGTVDVEDDRSAGTGKIVFNAGTFANVSTGDVTIANDFELGANITFNSSQGGTLSLTGKFTALTRDSTVEVLGDAPLRWQGNLVEGPIGTSYTFTGGSTVVLEGINEYTGGTKVDGSELIFFNSDALPTSGLISSTGTAYVGIGSPSVSNRFFSSLDPANLQGVVGLDSEPGATPNVFTSNVDLSRLSSSVYFGTISVAVMDGKLTPPSDSDRYNFGGHGALILRNSDPLTGTRSVHATTYGNADSPFLLVLSGSATND